MSNRYFDETNQVYYDVVYFYDVVFAINRRSGQDKREARRSAYDSVELRFGIKYSRARVIVSEMHKKGIRASESDKTRIMCENRDLMEVLRSINDEYRKY